MNISLVQINGTQVIFSYFSKSVSTEPSKIGLTFTKWSTSKLQRMLTWQKRKLFHYSLTERRKSFLDSFSWFLIQIIDFENQKMPYFDSLLLSHFVKYGKNLFFSMNVGQKDYLILCATLGNVFPRIILIIK